MATTPSLNPPAAAVHICERCKLPIDGPRFKLRVEADPAEPRGMELSLCKDCLASLGRWLDRKIRASEAGGADEPPEGRGRTRRRKASSRPWHADALDRGVKGLHVRMFLTAAAIVLAAAGLLGLAVSWLIKW